MKKFPEGNIVVMDYETDGLSPYKGDRPFVVGFEDTKGNVRVIRTDSPQWKEAVAIIEDPKIEKVCHNAKFEIKMSRHMGANPAGKFHDTMALSVLINEYQPINLADLSKRFFKEDYKDAVKDWLKASKKAFIQEYGREPNYSDVPDEILVPYLEKDLDSTLKLFIMWREHVEKFFPYLYDLETSLVWRIVDMEDRGIRIDIPYCEKRITELRALQDKLELEIYEAAGVRFNLASPKQVGQVLVALGAADYDEEGKVDTSYDTLKLKMKEHPFISSFITWRTLAKMIDTYLVPFTQKTCGDILHPSFWQYGKDKAIVTGRFSATDPNMQNIPKGIRGDKDALHELGDVVRKAVIPRKGYAFMFFDYKQIEMVIFACFTKDPQLIKAIAAGEDAYVANAKRFYGAKVFDGVTPEERKKLRYDAKELSLSLIYGMGVRSFAAKTKKSFQEARFLKNKYFAELPAARTFIMDSQSTLLQNGHVKDPFGRKYHVPTSMAYKAVNALCQGTAATLMKRAILASPALKKYGAHPVLTIHDELVLEVPIENVDVVAVEGKKLFEDYKTLPAPIRLDVEVSYTNWAEKKGWVPKE
jgi:DNA polymerase-1